MAKQSTPIASDAANTRRRRVRRSPPATTRDSFDDAIDETLSALRAENHVLIMVSEEERRRREDAHAEQQALEVQRAVEEATKVIERAKQSARFATSSPAPRP